MENAELENDGPHQAEKMTGLGEKPQGATLYNC